MGETDLISRQDAIDAMSCINDTICEGQAIEALWELPSAQPEPLTCHGCKHDNEWYEGCKNCIRLHSYKTDNYEEEQT